MKVAMQYLAPHIFVLTNGITKCWWTPSRLRPLMCKAPSSSFLVTRNLSSACSVVSSCEGRVVSSRVRSFSLDQLRLATTQTVAVDEAPELRKVEDSSDVEEQLELSSEPETKARVARRRDIGAFQQLPVVSPGLGTALSRAKMIKPTKERCQAGAEPGSQAVGCSNQGADNPSERICEEFSRMPAATSL